jgi:putative PIN family toxin of toxin-antitoxin system
MMNRFFSNEMVGYMYEMMENSTNVELITRYFSFELIKTDPDDNKFVDCAIASNADFIVTNDRHFAILNDTPFPKVKTLTIDEFMDVLRLPY